MVSASAETGFDSQKDTSRKPIIKKADEPRTAGNIFETPDFAYPRDVIATAEAILKASGSTDAQKLTAATQIVSAEYVIDSKSKASSYARIIKLANEVSEPAASAMLDVYAATLCNSMLDAAYRNKTVTPRPAEMSLWSMDDFKHVADSLLDAAYTKAPADAPLAPFAGALKYDAIGLRIVPTVRDFVVTQARAPYTFSKTHPVNENLSVFLQAKSMSIGQLRKYCFSHIGAPADAYAWWNYARRDDDNVTPSEAYAMLERADKAYTEPWVNDEIKERMDIYKRPVWTVRADQRQFGDSLRFSVSANNVDILHLKAYAFRDDKYANEKNLNKAYCVLNIDIPIHAGLDKASMDTCIAAPAGTYYITAPMDKSCIIMLSPWIPVFVHDGTHNTIYTVNAETGALAKNVKAQKLAWGAIKLEGEGIKLNVPIYIPKWAPAERTKENRATIWTDRSVYRPGETVKWALIAMNDTSVIEGKKLSMRVRKPSSPGQRTRRDTTFVLAPTDRYGRVAGEFAIPADSPTGGMGFDVMDGDSYIGSTYFSIDDFRLPDLDLKDVKYTTSTDSVFITGRTINAAAVGVSDIRVLCECSQEGLDFSTLSGNNGEFCVALPKDKLYPLTFVSVKAESPDGKSTKSDMMVTVNVKNPNELSASCEKKILNPQTNLKFNLRLKVRTQGLVADSVPLEWQLRYRVDGKLAKSGNAQLGDNIVTSNVLQGLAPSNYQLYICSTDTLAGVSPTTIYDLVYYNPADIRLPTDGKLWTPNANVELKPGQTEFNIEVGSAFTDPTTLYWFVYDKDGKISQQSAPIRQGFNKVTIRLTENPTAESYSVPMWAASRGAYEQLTITATPSPDKDKTGFAVKIESFRDRAIPGSTETWNVRTLFDGRPVQAAVAVNVYNAELLKFGGVTQPYIYYDRLIQKNISIEIPYGSPGKWLWHRNWDRKMPIWAPIQLPTWKYTTPNVNRGINGRVAGMKVMGYGTSSAHSEVVEESEAEEEVSSDSRVALNFAAPKLYGARSANDEGVMTTGGGNDAVMQGLQLRGKAQYTVLWAPELTTDADGRLDITFAVPNQNSTWKAWVAAWTRNLDFDIVNREFTASKPVIVAPNMPRFVRVGDTVRLTSAITNDTDSASNISYDVAVGTTDSICVCNRGTLDIPARSTRYVSVTTRIDGFVATADSLCLTIRAANSVYGDGERAVVPILPSTALVTESRNFYMGRNDSIYTTDVPAAVGSDDNSASLHFTANPMWTVVESLPEAITDCWPIATYQAQQLYMARTALDIVKAHPVAGEVIDAKKAREAEAEALKALAKLQYADGGFRWGTWSKKPDVYTTLNVLEWLDQDVDAYRKITDKALQYIDDNINPKTNKDIVDMTYALVRPAYGKPTTLGGKAVINATIRYIQKNWKTMSVRDKAMAANVLFANGYASTANRVLESLVQHSVDKGAKGVLLPNVRDVAGYALVLRAFSHNPKYAEYTDDVRQGLIYLRQGASWGDNGRTAYAVRAMVESGTDWTIPAAKVNVSVDGCEATLPESARLSGAFAIDVSNGAKIKVTRTPGTPAYGALMTRYVAPLTDIPAFSDGEIRVEKDVYAISPDGTRYKTTTYRPGQRLVVRIVITAERNMTGVIVNDLRPAAFEPVNQLSRYVWNAGRPYYLDNRDAVTNLYINYLQRGATAIEYEVTVNNLGTFTTGMTTVTSSETPELTAHSASTVFTVNEE